MQYKVNLFLALEEADSDDSTEEDDNADAMTVDDSVASVPQSHLKDKEGHEEKKSKEGDASKKDKTPKPAAIRNVSLRDQRDVRTRVRAYIFADKLYDITSDLKEAGVSVQDRDQIVGIYETESPIPHFIYYSKSNNKIHLFQFLVVDKTGVGKSKNVKHQIKNLKGGPDKKAWTDILEKREKEDHTGDFVIRFIDRCPFKPGELVHNHF